MSELGREVNQPGEVIPSSTRADAPGLGVEYPFLFDHRREVALAFRSFPANAVPSTILRDREGRVAAVYTGAVARDDLRTSVTTLLEVGGS